MDASRPANIAFTSHAGRVFEGYPSRDRHYRGVPEVRSEIDLWFCVRARPLCVRARPALCQGTTSQLAEKPRTPETKKPALEARFTPQQEATAPCRLILNIIRTPARPPGNHASRFGNPPQLLCQSTTSQLAKPRSVAMVAGSAACVASTNRGRQVRKALLMAEFLRRATWLGTS